MRLIDAEELERLFYEQVERGATDLFDAFDDALQDAQTVDAVAVVRGQWIEDHDYLKCPECGVMVKRDFTFFDVGDWNFCPNCGAKMEGGADNAAD